MDKEHILQKIQEYAEAHQGKSPGRYVIETIYGIKPTDWEGKYWPRWNDALNEAGLSPNTMKTAYDFDHLISLYIEYIREIGRLPVKAEFRIKSRKDNTFPAYDTFINHLGKKSGHPELLKRHCEKTDGYEDIIAICDNAIRLAPPKKHSESSPEKSTDNTVHGYVYLLKSGKHYKIG